METEINSISRVIKDVEAVPDPRSQAQSLASALRDANRYIQELEEIINSKLLANNKKVKRTAWIRSKHRIDELRILLKEARATLIASTGVSSLYASSRMQTQQDKLLTMFQTDLHLRIEQNQLLRDMLHHVQLTNNRQALIGLRLENITSTAVLSSPSNGSLSQSLEEFARSSTHITPAVGSLVQHNIQAPPSQMIGHEIVGNDGPQEDVSDTTSETFWTCLSSNSDVGNLSDIQELSMSNDIRTCWVLNSVISFGD